MHVMQNCKQLYPLHVTLDTVEVAISATRDTVYIIGYLSLERDTHFGRKTTKNLI